MLCRFVYVLLYINVYSLREPPIQLLSLQPIPITGLIQSIGSCSTGADIVYLVQQHQEVMSPNSLGFHLQ
jgi:hypothetical protein